MVVHRSGENRIAVYIESTEMSARGWVELGEAEARAIVGNAISDLGLLPAWPREIETYAGECGAMIFACLSAVTEEHAYFLFAHMNGLFDACASMNDTGVRAELFFCGGQYVLHVSGAGASYDRLVWHLHEFAAPLMRGKDFALHLAEHGERLIASHAIEALRG